MSPHYAACRLWRKGACPSSMARPKACKKVLPIQVGPPSVSSNHFANCGSLLNTIFKEKQTTKLASQHQRLLLCIVSVTLFQSVILLSFVLCDPLCQVHGQKPWCRQMRVRSMWLSSNCSRVWSTNWWG